jgi:hypothetical protein
LSALVALGVELGVGLGKRIFSRLVDRPRADEKLKEADALISTGVSAVSALRATFGSDFDSAVSAALDTAPSAWSFESGRADYIKLTVQEGDSCGIYKVLRDELNINLDRVARTAIKNKADQWNYFRGAFREWMDRYRLLAGHQSDVEDTFRVIDSLLDGNRRNFADALRLLQRTGLGIAGAVLVLKAAFVATGTGVGLLVAASTWLFGIPMVQVGALAVGGGLLLALSRVEFKPTNAMSASISVAYRLLDRAQKRDASSVG